MAYSMSVQCFEPGRRGGLRSRCLALLLAWVVAVAPVLLGAHELEHLDAPHHASACDLCLTGSGLHHAGLAAAVPDLGSAADAVVIRGPVTTLPPSRYSRSGQARAPPSDLCV